MTKLKTKILKLNPTQVKVNWVDDKGFKIDDPKQTCTSYLWEAEFIGVDIDPLTVKSIKFPKLKYSDNKDYFVEVEVITDPRVANRKE
jgi:hypothetical protein